jgi:hypothetical protein
MSKCTITAADTVQVTSTGFVVNGEFRSSLSGCTIKDGVKFVVQVAEDKAPVVHTNSSGLPTPPIVNPQGGMHNTVPAHNVHSSNVAVAPGQTMQTEAGELQEALALIKAVSGGSPLLTLALLGVFIWLKLNKMKNMQSCVGCVELTARVDKLEAADRATDTVLALINKEISTRENTKKD